MNILAYPGDMSWAMPIMVAVGAATMIAIVVLSGFIRRGRRRAKAQARAEAQEALRRLRARYERHEASKAKVRFVPTDDTTDTR